MIRIVLKNLKLISLFSNKAINSYITTIKQRRNVIAQWVTCWIFSKTKKISFGVPR